MCSIEAKYCNKTSREFYFHFLLSSSIVDVEYSESSLKIVRSHDPLSENTQVSKTVCEHNGIPMKDMEGIIRQFTLYA